MRGNGTLGRADLVAARVQALLATEAGDDVAPAASAAAPDVADVELLGPGEEPGRRRPARSRPGWSDRLMARVPVRLDPGRRAALAVGVAVIVAALVAGAWLVANRPQAVPVSAAAPSVPGAGPLVGTDGVTEGAGAAGSTAAAAPTPAAPSPTGSAEVVVDVAGKVRNPGVYRLPTGSRVDDAVHAAGGVRGRVDLSRLNLAAPLVDGQQIAVGVPAAAGGGAPVAAGASSSGGTVVDINTATLEELETLPGVGPVLGQDILDYRDAHGSFTTIQQLENVSGIGDVTFGDLKSLVTV